MGWLSFALRRFFLLAGREIDRGDGPLRTFQFAFAARLALGRVDVGEVVLERDGFERTYLHAFSAPDACRRAGFPGKGSFVFVDALHVYTAVVLALRADFDDVPRTSLGTGSTRRTFRFIHLGNPCFGIYPDGVKLACAYAIAISQAAEETSRFSSACGVCYCARAYPVVLGQLRTVGARAVTSYHGYFRLGYRGFQSQDSGYFLHRRLSAYRAEFPVERACLHACGGKA